MDYLFSIVTVGQLRKHKEALDFAIAAETLAPSNSEIGRTMESIREELAAGWWQFIMLFMSQFFLFIYVVQTPSIARTLGTST